MARGGWKTRSQRWQKCYGWIQVIPKGRNEECPSTVQLWVERREVEARLGGRMCWSLESSAFTVHTAEDTNKLPHRSLKWPELPISSWQVGWADKGRPEIKHLKMPPKESTKTSTKRFNCFMPQFPINTIMMPNISTGSELNAGNGSIPKK
jgi:hypothetical protein